MNNSQLKQLFPQVKENPEEKKKYLEAKIDNQEVYFPLSDLSEREKMLLSLLENRSQHMSDSPWQNFLENNAKQPSSADRLRFLYFKVDDLDNSVRSKWKHQLESFFTKTVHDFWENKNCLILVDEECLFTRDDLIGIITTIDSDFSTKTKLFIGLIWNKNDDLVTLFKEEKMILKKVAWKKQTATVPECALEFFTHFNQVQSKILLSYRNKFNKNGDIKQLVHSLYKVTGNISQAAKSMYIHRNTLEYRVEKLNSDYQLNLHQMDDLIFCYLVFV